jgi:hypothetical protein
MKRFFDSILRGQSSRRNERGRDAKLSRSTKMTTTIVTTLMTVLLMMLFSINDLSATTTITLTPAGGNSFNDKTYGYSGAQSAKNVTIANTGGEATGAITISLSSDEAFELTKTTITDIAASGSETFGVRPKLGLAAGDYSVVVTVAGTNFTTETLTITLKVKKVDITAVSGLTATKEYDGSANFSPGDLIGVGSVTLTGNLDGSNLTLDASSASVSVTSADVQSGTAATVSGFKLGGSAAGNYTLTVQPVVTASITKVDPTANDLVFAPSPVIYDGTSKSVSLPVAKNSSSGITVASTSLKYDGSSTPPTNAGTYRITVNVYSTTNFNWYSDLYVGDFIIKKAIPTPDELDITISSGGPYKGSPYVDTDIQAASGVTGLGSISWTYNGSATPPVNAGTYTVTAVLGEGTNYTAKSINVGSFTISKIVPSASNLSFTPSYATYNGSPQGVKVIPNSPYTGLGAYTVYYSGTNYPKSRNAPTNAGRYEITIDIAGDANFVAASVSLGNFYIYQAAPQFNITPSSVTYNGSPQGVTVSPKVSGMGAITAVYYESADGTTYPQSKTAPTNAGTYKIIVAVNSSTNYYGILGQIGWFTINKATPTTEDLVLDTEVYNGYMYYHYTGNPQGFPTPTALYSGLGAITAYYEGVKGTDTEYYRKTTNAPVETGTYAVTVNIASGDNYTAISNLLVGYVVITELPAPTVQQHVTLNVSQHFASNPAPGEFYVISGRNLNITLTPRASLPEGYTPKVTTDRRIYPDDKGGVKVTPNDDGTYTVLIAYISERTTVTIEAVEIQSGPTGNEIVSGVTRVWSYGQQLYIAAGANEGQARIYNVAGVLVKTVRFTSGETVETTLPAGIYIVATEKQKFKVVINN